MLRPTDYFRRLVLAGLTLALAGCVNAPDPFRPWETAKYSVENTGKFAVLDTAAVSCTGLQEHFNADGRLELVANVQNRGTAPQQVRVRCVFKDASGFSTGDVTAWQVLQLEGGATEAVRFVSVNSLARKYTVTVRLPN